MHMIPSAHPADISIEVGTYVIQLVQDGYQLLLKCLILKPWKIKREDVKHLGITIEEPLDRPDAAGAMGKQSAVFKPHRSQLCLQTVRTPSACLGKGDGHFVHADMLKLRKPVNNILAQPAHRPREVERRRPGIVVRESFLQQTIHPFRLLFVFRFGIRIGFSRLLGLSRFRLGC